MRRCVRICSFILAGLFFSNGSFAEIGRIETKRERLAREAKPPSERKYHAAYAELHENFLRENYAEVNRLADSYLSGSGTKPNEEDVLYLQALSLLKLKRGEEARAKLIALENAFVSSERKASISASIADSYFYEGDHANAYQVYQDTLKKYPDSDQTNYVMFKLKELSIRLGKPFSNRPGNLQAKPSVGRFSAVAPVAASNAHPLKQLSFEEAPFFAVQVGSFSKARNADALIRKLIYRQYDAYLDRERQTGMYRVRVGHLSSKNEAEALEARLKREGYPTQIIP